MGNVIDFHTPEELANIAAAKAGRAFEEMLRARWIAQNPGATASQYEQAMDFIENLAWKSPVKGGAA